MTKNNRKKRILIDLSVSCINYMKSEAKSNGLSRKKHIETLLEDRAVRANKSQLKLFKEKK